MLSQNHPGERLSKGQDWESNLSECLSFKPPGNPHGEKPYKCKECGKGSFRLSGLLIHLWHHSGERPYKCDNVARCFPRMLNLLTFKCNNYGKAFPPSASLLDHQRLHNGEKPYGCSEWGGGSAHSEEEPYFALHTGESLHECKDCGKVFGSNRNLLDCERLHNGRSHMNVESVGKRLWWSKLPEAIRNPEPTRESLPEWRLWEGFQL